MGFSLSDLDPIKGLKSAGRKIDDEVFQPLLDVGRDLDKKVFQPISGKTARDAAEEAAEVQATAAQQAANLFNPFQAIGQQGLGSASILTDPQAQFDFLQSNPLFNLGLENLNQQTIKSAAASGRVGATDTNQQLINNALLAASPLIGQQQSNVSNLLNLGVQTAGAQGNLLTDKAAAIAGGKVGSANAAGQGVKNLFDIGAKLLGSL